MQHNILAEWEAASYRKIKDHPCFDEQAAHRFGRMHLPVAPACNIKCKYCDQCYDCVNESRPGVTSQVLAPSQAIVKVREVVAKFPFIKVIAVAGPGEPLFNEETFEILGLVKREFPYLRLCLSTNGLLLQDNLDLLKELGVSTLTVTINAVEPYIGKEIYSWVYYKGAYLRGVEKAEVLMSRQLEGVKRAVEMGIVVKVNTVFIPSVNHDHLIDIARKMCELGVWKMNIMPLIPHSEFGHLRRPTLDELKNARSECGQFLRQMYHCRQCRADAIGLLGRDLCSTAYSTDIPEGRKAPEGIKTL